MKRIPDYLPYNVRELLQLTDHIFCAEFEEPPICGNGTGFDDPGCAGWELWHCDDPAEPVRILSPGSYEEFASVIQALLNT